MLTSADGSDGEVIATDRRLLWPAGEIRWVEVESASWDGDDESLRITPVTRAQRAPTFRIRLTEPGRLVDVVREQVTGSIVISRHVPVDGPRGVRVTGRRTVDGELIWNAVVDAGLDAADPETKARLDAAVAGVRQQAE